MERRQCFQCRQLKTASSFSNSQWRLQASARLRCLPCLEVWKLENVLAATEVEGLKKYIAAWLHDKSGGVQKYGKKVHLPGRACSFKARPLRQDERAEGVELFHVCNIDVIEPVLEEPVQLTLDKLVLQIPDLREALESSMLKFNLLRKRYANTEVAVPPACLTDFMSTLLRAHVPGARKRLVPNLLPTASQNKYLNLSFDGGAEMYIYCLPPECVVRDVEGTALLDSRGVLVAARLPNPLPQRAIRELVLLVNQLTEFSPYMARGSGVASVATAFSVIGLKCDMYASKQMLVHQWCTSFSDPMQILRATQVLPTPCPKAKAHTHTALTFCVVSKQVYDRFYDVYKNLIHPFVAEYLLPLFQPLVSWLAKEGICLFCHQVTAVSVGRLFWPRSHVDPKDAGYSILVCLDVGQGVQGAHFAFAAHGTVLELQHGDVMVFNPLHYHGTTEAQVLWAATLPCGWVMMLAFGLLVLQGSKMCKHF
jgi:hypothetical protein